ncbi:T9SS type A sorting domain-containing protein [Polaribacter sp. L3A8]|uniref:T9SS type A sorting domain-containing protein n=1 Tax=Polaribacter sp. L3A8 TaxID=2686361 RepID=UPI00131E0934|nr:T9SS type A sorting domain-containing protein [Polaribacter sp. L3A8]
MELYGADYIMSANAGLPKTLAERKEPEHENYFWRHAGNNTMIVNGTTHGIQPGSWNTDSYLWMNTTVNVAAEPKHLEDPINPNFSFATQFLDDTVNNDQQKRTLSTIRTSETTGYYFDMFRSKSLGTNNFHDYIYHNLGDVTNIMTMDGTELPVSATTRYQNDIGDLQKSPGWRFFEDTNVTQSTDAAIQVRFDLNETNTYMNMFAASGVSREYTKALGPATREAKGGYINKKTQIVAVRQQGEAWNKPYVYIFEPSKSTNTSVKSTEHLYRGNVIVGAKVKSQIGDKVVTDYVICQEDASKVLSLPDVGIEFTGHFAVVRHEQTLDKAYVTLYIGEGTSLTYGEHSLNADTTKKGQKVIEVSADLSRVVGFKDLKNNQEIPKGSDLSVEAIVGSDFTEATLYVNNVNVGTLTEEPYVWSSIPELTNMTELSYLIKIEVKDSEGKIEERTLTILTPNQWAYTTDNKPHSIPGKIEFEHYDNGGIDIAYWDKKNQNSSSFRPTEMVDISTNGETVRDIKSGEWLEFTIDVAQSGNYDLEVTHQTRRSPAFKQLTVSFPDENVTFLSDIILTNTGSGTYLTETIGSIDLEAGTHVLRFSLLDFGFDLDSFEFKLKSLSLPEDIITNKSEIKVYPNPTINSFTIKLTKMVWESLSIYNVLGKKVYRNNSGKEELFIDVKESKMKSGLYFLVIGDSFGKQHTKKIIVK